MPTSVLLAVLVAAGLLALAPALVRRHDAVERQVAERAQSGARVLSRDRRRRSVPGRRPVNPSRVLVPRLRVAAPRDDPPPTDPPAPASTNPPIPADHEPRYVVARRSGPPSHDRRAGRRAGGALEAVPGSAPPARAATRSRRPRNSPAIYRRRRVLAALLLLNLAELAGLVAVGPGFWVGFAVTGTLLLTYLVHLRNLALADRRRRRADARREAALAAQQAEVRREQERRVAARRETARRMAEQRESLRRASASWSVPPTVSYRPATPPRRRQAG